ncbi:hypothetical protein HYS72_01980 [Candidatus Pacearchaeota archaeon]|nr:hypothetical protein [Candidatus Pacearchaeota archaeon]MBI2057004.1 hypothetical protein [Candidatus Pacearchaeota archaeon]
MTESLIHVGLNREELINSKKEILSTEADLIRILQVIKKYQLLRTNELKLKTRLFKKLKETKAEIKKLEEILPKPKIPRILLGIENKKDEFKISSKKDNLESQLEEIQKKLRELER